MPWPLLLAACIDYDPHPVGSGRLPGDSGFAELTIPGELCNGIDDDGDGAVDEGYVDSDGDGAPDCVCDVSAGVATILPEAFTCDADTVSTGGELSLDPLWSVQDYPSEVGGCSGFAIADLEGDGGVEIVCARSYGPLEVFGALTGELLATWDNGSADAEVLLADTDGDGTAEIWTTDVEDRLVAYGPTGEVLLQGTEKPSDYPMYGLAFGGIVQWPGAGVVIVGGDRVLSAHDGATVVEFDDGARPFQVPLPADADLDGVVEVYRGGRRFDETGATVWSLAPFSNGRTGYVRLVQADADPEGELLWVTDEDWALCEADGTVIQTGTAPTEGAQAEPCVGSNTGGGGSQFFLEDGLYEEARGIPLGVMRWGAGVDDWSTGASCSAFDVNGDGIDEVTLADEEAVRVLDGATGAQLASTAAPSLTIYEVPSWVDLDGDGTPEIVTHSVGSWAVGGHPPAAVPADIIKVFRLNGITAAMGGNWPMRSWTGTELNPDLTVPRTPRPAWLTTCAVPSQPVAEPWGSDLAPAVVDACAVSCDVGPVTMAVAIENLGPQEREGDTPLAVYTAAGVLLEVLTIPGWIDDGSRAAAAVFTTTLAHAEAGLVFVAGDDGSGAVRPDDPAADNDRLEWRFEGCDR